MQEPRQPLKPTQGALPIGFIAKGPEGQSVSQSLTAAGIALQPGTTYHYRVLAVRRVQSENGINWQGPPIAGPDHTFTTPPPPVIDSVSVSHLTSSGATLEAQINTEGVSTLYQFQLSSICGGKGACLVVINYPLPSGLLLGSFVDQSVSLDLNSAGVTLQPGGTYSYSVSATSAAGTTERSSGQSFTTPEDAVVPLNTTTSPPSGTVPASSNSGDQPAGSGGSSSSSTSGVKSLGTGVRKTTKLKSLTNAQKLAKGLKVCEKKPKKQRASCRRQAEKKYATTSKHRP